MARIGWVGAAIVAVVLGLVPEPAAAREAVRREQSRKTVDARGLAAVRVENAKGAIVIRPSDDARIHLTALRIARGNSDSEVAALAERIRVLSDIEGDTYVVRVEYPRRRKIDVSLWDLMQGMELPRAEVRLTLEIPPELAVRLEATSGDLSTESLEGAQRLESTSGDLDVRDAAGPLEISTTSGDAQVLRAARVRMRTVSGDAVIRDARGPVSIGTTSGDVLLDGARDSIRAATVSGDLRITGAPRGVSAKSTSGTVSIRDASGVVAVETVSGDIRLRLTGGLRSASIAASSGDVNLEIPRAGGCTLELRTTSGTLDVGVPLEVRTVSRRNIVGTVGKGGPPIDVRTSSGDVNVLAPRGES